MKRLRCIIRDQDGVAAIESAFALPVLIVMLWMFVQLAQMYCALAGIQQALGEGARYATVCLNPTAAGCSIPTATQIQTRITNNVYRIGSGGTFTVTTPVKGTAGSSSYYDLTVNYSQPTNLLLFPGPTISLTRFKRVWVAGS
jgi:Flp pilus assembly protein TadG